MIRKKSILNFVLTDDYIQFRQMHSILTIPCQLRQNRRRVLLSVLVEKGIQPLNQRMSVRGWGDIEP